MIILPAIDLKEGRCVRLEQGLMDKDTVYNDDPGAQARIWQDQGGELLHIVDLDGAFAGVPKTRTPSAPLSTPSISPASWVAAFAIWLPSRPISISVSTG